MTTQHVIWSVLVGLFVIAMLVRLVCAAGKTLKSDVRAISMGNVDDEFFIPGDKGSVEHPTVDYTDVYEDDK